MRRSVGQREETVAAFARAAGALFAGALLACSSADRDLSSEIERLVQRGEGTVVNLSEVTDFTWQRLHVFPPYTPVERIHRALGFRWPNDSQTNIEMLDDFTLLVFTTQREVVRFVEHPRNAGDFAYVHREGGYTPETAVFVVREEDHGVPWLVLRPLDSEPVAR